MRDVSERRLRRSVEDKGPRYSCTVAESFMFIFGLSDVTTRPLDWPLIFVFVTLKVSWSWVLRVRVIYTGQSNIEPNHYNWYILRTTYGFNNIYIKT